jgi:hypothetical protein
LIIQQLGLIDEEDDVLTVPVAFQKEFLQGVLLGHKAALRLDFEVRADVLQHPEERGKLWGWYEGRSVIILRGILTVQIPEHGGLTHSHVPEGRARQSLPFVDRKTGFS